MQKDKGPMSSSASRDRARLTPRPGILDIAPYVPGAGPSDAENIHKLSANESALGASEAAIAAYRAAGDHVTIYADGAATALRETIAEIEGVDVSNIVCGAGSDELLQLLARGYLGPGDAIVQTAHGFLVYGLAAKACGADIRIAPETHLTADVDAILDAVDASVRIVFLANPNNPTGTYISEAELRRLREYLPPDILLVIDAAYAEYVDAPDYTAGAALVEENDNVVMTRTFSKIFGLASLRLGWAYCPPAVADVLNRIRGPFNVSGPAMAAGAAAFRDRDFVERNRAHNKAERDWLAQQLGGLGLDVNPSVGNFLLVKFPDAPGRRASDILQFLASRGVFVRDVEAYGLPDYLRISIGETQANRRLVTLLAEMFPS